MIENKVKKALKTVVFGICFFPIISQAQTNVLEKYISIGLAENLQLQKLELDLQKQDYKVKEATSNRLPVVTFEPSYILAAGGRRLNFPIGDLFNPSNQLINQLAQTDALPTNLENVDEQLTPSNFHDTRVYASYPLFNPAIYYNIKAQEQLMTVEEAKIAAFKNELAKEIKVAYYNYFKTFEVLNIFEESEDLLKEVYRFNQKLVKYDKATADVLAGVTFEIEKINSDRAAILQQQAITKAQFNALLNRDFATSIEKDINFDPSTTAAQALTTLKETALKNRPEITQIDNAIKATQIVTEIESKQLIPTVGLQASAGFQGFGYENFADDQLLGTLAIGAKWTIFDGKKRKHKIEQSKIETQLLQKEQAHLKQQIALQVTNAWHAIEAANKKAVAEQAAVESAQQNFNLINKRYKNEKAILIELLDARTKLLNAKVRQSIAQYDVLIRQAELQQAISY